MTIPFEAPWSVKVEPLSSNSIASALSTRRTSMASLISVATVVLMVVPLDRGNGVATASWFPRGYHGGGRFPSWSVRFRPVDRSDDPH